jgi:hypothetical protein
MNFPELLVMMRLQIILDQKVKSERYSIKSGRRLLTQFINARGSLLTISAFFHTGSKPSYSGLAYLKALPIIHQT